MRGLFLSGFLVIAFPPQGYAGSFGVDPVRLTFPPGARSTSLSLQNHADEPVLVQSEVMAWAQQEGRDVLTPSRDLVVSPPLFKVAPGATQIVRVGLLRPPAADREVTYRLFLLEVPPPPRAGEMGVVTRLRLGLPVFVLPPRPAAPILKWRARNAPNGDIELSLGNEGNAHVQAIDFKLYLPDGTLIAEESRAAYVLPAQARSWQMKPKQPWQGEKLKLNARTSGGEIVAEIPAD
jgi:fimbrial chaperone protein